MTGPAPRSAKLRRAALVLLALAVLAFVGAITGWDAHGSGGRVVLAVVGVLFALLGLALLRTRTPGVSQFRAEQRGLLVAIHGGGTALVPWSSLADASFRVLNAPRALPRLNAFAGYQLELTLHPGAHLDQRLRPFRTSDRQLLFGLTRAQHDELSRALAALDPGTWKPSQPPSRS